ncbi:helix-turn-helix domain-containing protein [Anaerotignum sp. MB30-C6]|uniref:helix-turn-helix domain-containing protein n=1 Tax=Anaerotignum sp. MB30-C6 TaxID=3070814 RepID=UPI002FE6C845
MLKRGVLPIDVALQTGFTDQSHFSNFFKRFIGLTPKQILRLLEKIGQSKLILINKQTKRYRVS